MSATATASEDIELTLAQRDIDILHAAVEKLITVYERDLCTAKGRGRHGRAETIRHHLTALSRFESALRDADVDPDTGLPRVTHDPERPGHLRRELSRLYASCAPEPAEVASETASGAGLEELATLVAGWAHRA